MAVIERDVVLMGKDGDHSTIDLPITCLKNVEDTADVKEAPTAEDYLPVVDSTDGGQMKKTPLGVILEPLEAAQTAAQAARETAEGAEQTAAEAKAAAEEAAGSAAGAQLAAQIAQEAAQGAGAAADTAVETAAGAAQTAQEAKETAQAAATMEQVNAAIQAGGGAHKVGDILTTRRTDLGNDWMLCNGDPFDPEKYPELAAITPDIETMLELKRDGANILSISSISRAFQSIATHGGISVASFLYSRSGSGTSTIYYPKLFYSDDGFVTSTSVLNADSSSAPGVSLNVFYTNGTWICTHWALSGLYAIYETTDPTGTWTQHKISAPADYPGIVQHIEYYNGKYYFFGGDIRNSDTSPTWAKVAPWVGYTESLNTTALLKLDLGMPTYPYTYRACFVRSDKFEFFLTGANATGSTNTKVLRRYVADTPDGEWATSESSIVFSEDGILPCRQVYYCPEDGGFYYGGCTKGGKLGLYIFDGENPATCVMTGNVSGGVEFSAVVYARRNIVGINTAGTVMILPIDDPDAVSVVIDGVPAPTSTSSSNYFSWAKILLDDDHILLPKPSSDAVKVLRIPLHAVPEISQPQSYTYIKAKEDDTDADQQADAPAP